MAAVALRQPCATVLARATKDVPPSSSLPANQSFGPGAAEGRQSPGGDATKGQPELARTTSSTSAAITLRATGSTSVNRPGSQGTPAAYGLQSPAAHSLGVHQELARSTTAPLPTRTISKTSANKPSTAGAVAGRDCMSTVPCSSGGLPAIVRTCIAAPVSRIASKTTVKTIASPALDRTLSSTSTVRPVSRQIDRLERSQVVRSITGTSPNQDSATKGGLPALRRTISGSTAFAGRLIVSCPSPPTTAASSDAPIRPTVAVLRLPVPTRGQPQAALGEPRISSPPAMLPANVTVPPGLPVKPAAASSRTSRVPARLQILDDQTKIPREVYNRMLEAGDTARGIFGYGQHRLTFAGASGAPVLRLSSVPR